MPHEAVIGLYRRHAQAWADARRRPSPRGFMEAGWLDRFAALLPREAAVLDLGCGPGEPLACALVERGYAVTGVDASPEMVALCERRLPGQDWLVADMRGLALGRAFDGILAWDSFFHLCPEDQRGMFAVFRAHAAPCAGLMFTSGPSHGVALGTLEGETLYHASLDPAEYRSLLREHGFATVDHIAEDPACGGHTVWLAQRV